MAEIKLLKYIIEARGLKTGLRYRIITTLACAKLAALVILPDVRKPTSDGRLPRSITDDPINERRQAP